MLPGDTDAVVTYNGVSIVDQGSLHTRVNAKWVLDDARRTVKYTEYEIYIKGYVTLSGLAEDSSSTDAYLGVLRGNLAEIGRGLVFTGKGYGNIIVNESQDNLSEGQVSVEDANWGPIPQVLQWVPIGDDITAAVEFRVTCHIPTCEERTPQYTKAIMAFGWAVSYMNDKDGYTQVTVNGYIEIPMSRALNSSVAPDTIDNYRKQCFPLPILGFQRDKFDWRPEPNRRRATFTVTDTMLPKPLPPNVTTCDLEETLFNEAPLPVAMLTLSGTIRVAAGQSPGLAYSTFQAVVAQRLIAGGLRISPQMQIIPALPSNAARILVLPLSFQFSEQVFGKDSRFTMKYQLFPSGGVNGSNKLQWLLGASGLWTVLKNYSFQKWQASMLASKVLTPNSVAGLKLQATDDILIDLCSAAPSGGYVRMGEPTGGYVQQPPGGGGYSPAPLTGGYSASISGASAQISPDQSWTGYIVFVELVQFNGLAAHKPLVGLVAPELPIAIEVTSAQAARAAVRTPGSDQVVAGYPGDSIQQVTTPTAWLRVFGRATRLSFPIDAPQLLRVGQIPAVEWQRRIATGVVRQYGDVPETFCNWDILYRLSVPPVRVPVIANPYLNSPGSTS